MPDSMHGLHCLHDQRLNRGLFKKRQEEASRQSNSQLANYPTTTSLAYDAVKVQTLGLELMCMVYLNAEST